MVDSFKFDEVENLIMDAIDMAGYRVRGYTADESCPADKYDFATTQQLHNAYMRHCFRVNPPECLIVTNLGKFGQRLNNMLAPNATKHRMWVKNKKTEEMELKSGFRGIRGPDTHRLQMRPGRPKVSDVDKDTQTIT